MILEATPPPKEPATGEFISPDLQSPKEGDLEAEQSQKKKQIQKRDNYGQTQKPCNGSVHNHCWLAHIN